MPIPHAILTIIKRRPCMCRLMTDVAVNLLSNPLHNKCNCNLKLNQVPRREGTRIRDVDAPRGGI